MDTKSEEDIEITVESNPGTLTEDKLAVLLGSGVNRLSIGLQSTDNAMLARLGRIHTFEEFLANYDLARRIGFGNINIDLMSALPGQSTRSWLETLDIVTSLRPDHISAYSLIIEEGTPVAESKSILSSLPDEETDRRMYELTKEKLAAAGYRRYEISNYALPGKECRHNMGYWDGTPYLGLGLGASSYYNHARFSNVTEIRSYLDKPFQPVEEREGYEKQSMKQEMEDRMIFGLRMMQGVSKKGFRKSFGRDMDDVYGDVISKYVSLGLLTESEDRVRLTDRGIDVSNRIFEEFLQ